MTRTELLAAVETVLEEPRSTPGRLDTIMAAVDRYAIEAAATAVAVVVTATGREEPVSSLAGGICRDRAACEERQPPLFGETT